MLCVQCRREIADESNYCSFCGTHQYPQRDQPPGGRRLTRSISERQIAGVCGGLAEYFSVDVSLVRLTWIVLTIVPGAIFFGIVAYLAAWLLVPEVGTAATETPPAKRLMRSTTDRKVGGVCGGIAEFFGVDSTAVRLLWVILSVVPGVIIGGMLAYLVAWFVMPGSPQPEPTVSQAPSSTT